MIVMCSGIYSSAHILPAQIFTIWANTFNAREIGLFMGKYPICAIVPCSQIFKWTNAHLPVRPTLTYEQKIFCRINCRGAGEGENNNQRNQKKNLMIASNSALTAGLERTKLPFTFFSIFLNFQMDPNQLAADDRKQKHVSFDSSSLMR